MTSIQHIDANLWRPDSTVEDMNHLTTYIGDLFVVKNVVENKPHFLEKLITQEWFINVQQVLSNNNVLNLNFEFSKTELRGQFTLYVL